jgi:hypothetical protein
MSYHLLVMAETCRRLQSLTGVRQMSIPLQQNLQWLRVTVSFIAVPDKHL